MERTGKESVQRTAFHFSGGGYIAEVIPSGRPLLKYAMTHTIFINPDHSHDHRSLRMNAVFEKGKGFWSSGAASSVVG